MAKKKQEEEPQKQEESKDGPTLAHVAREALSQLGADASIADAEGWIARNYPGWTYNKTTLGTTLSNQRKKMREQGAEALPHTSAATMDGGSSVPSGEDLLKVKRLAGQHGGIGSLLKQVQTVHDLGLEVGGLDKLLRCLEMLQELVGK